MSIDIGFGLENFDPVGAWRDIESVGRDKVPINPGGTLPDGSEFSNVLELKTTLLVHKKDLAEGLVESLLIYGLGRSVEFSDADDVESILGEIADDDYRFRDMIKSVARSQLFQRR